MLSRLLSIENYGPPPKLLEYFGNRTHPGSHIPFYYFLTFAENEWNATVLDFFIHWQTDVLPRSSYNWVVSHQKLYNYTQKYKCINNHIIKFTAARHDIALNNLGEKG